jgi:hypothetical protein
LAVLVEVAFFLPDHSHIGVVHPTVEHRKVGLEVEAAKREGLAEPGNEALVEHAARLGRAHGVALAVGQRVLQGHGRVHCG